MDSRGSSRNIVSGEAVSLAPLAGKFKNQFFSHGIASRVAVCLYDLLLLNIEEGEEKLKTIRKKVSRQTVYFSVSATLFCGNSFHCFSGGKLFGIFFSLGGTCSKELIAAGHPDGKRFFMFRSGFRYHRVDGWRQMA